MSPSGSTLSEIDFDATGTLLDAVNKLAETYVDVRMSYDTGLVLDMYAKDARGTATAVDLSGADLKSHAVETSYEIGNTVALVRDRGIYLMDSDLSVLAYGPRPAGSLQVGPIDDGDTLEAVGAAFLDGLTTPGESIVVEVSPIVDLPVEPGDTITVESDVVRVTEIAFELDEIGELRKVPALVTPYQQARQRAGRTVDRLVREVGNSSGSRVIDTGTNIPSGRLDPVKITSWSWTESTDLDVTTWDTDGDNPVGWQFYPVEEPMRLWAIVAEGSWAEPDGADGLTTVSTGETQFSLRIDDGPAPVPLIVTLPEDSGTSWPHVEAVQYIFGPALVMPGQTLSVAPILNGGHINGSVTIWGTEAL
jgi:hypothetical protein